MNVYDFAFYAVSFLAVPLWLMMILLPKHSLTKRIMGSVYIVVPFAVPYAVLVLAHFQDILLFLAPTPSKIEELLTHPYSDVLAWLHFIPLDLFAGRWIYLDSRQKNFNVFAMVPILSLCLLLPPLGFVLYFIFRFINSKRQSEGQPEPSVTANAGSEL